MYGELIHPPLYPDESAAVGEDLESQKDVGCNGNPGNNTTLHLDQRACQALVNGN